MEVCEHRVASDCVVINSTGYGVKVFLGLLMADRLNVIDMKRRAARERIGFLVVGFGELDHGEGEGRCNVCLEEMTPESVGEVPLRMVVCCGQVIGGDCLRQWVNSLTGCHLEPTCPLCRYELAEAFVDKLFEGYEEERAKVPECVDEEGSGLEMSFETIEDLDEAVFGPDAYPRWRMVVATETHVESQSFVNGDNIGSPVQQRFGGREDDIGTAG